MKFDYSGTPLNGRVPQYSAFRTMLYVFLVYYALHNILTAVTQPYFTAEFHQETGTYTYPTDVPVWATVVHGINQGLAAAYGLFVLVMLIRTRSHIRAKYQIPEENCKGCEDCCCAFWCGACTVCQMARHTADYSQYNASCCTETGLDPLAPEVV
jgi:Cys-rich protein (TIGR01571 family)